MQTSYRCAKKLPILTGHATQGRFCRLSIESVVKSKIVLNNFGTFLLPRCKIHSLFLYLTSAVSTLTTFKESHVVREVGGQEIEKQTSNITWDFDH